MKQLSSSKGNNIRIRQNDTDSQPLLIPYVTSLVTKRCCMAKKQMKNLPVKIVAVLILVFVAVAFLRGTVMKRQSVIEQGPAARSTDVQVVDGVQQVTLSWGKFNYAPETIMLKDGVPARIIADTKRLQGCFRSIQIPDLGISKVFTESDNVLEFTPSKAGTFRFSCAMGMGAGTLTVT